MHTPCRVAVLGGGSFGTAIANLIAENEHDVYLWLRSEERAEEINLQRVNKQYLPDLTLNERVKASVDLSEVVAGAEFVFVAVPSGSCRAVAQLLSKTIAPDTALISLTKGIEAETFDLMSQVLAEVLPDHPLGVMSGPNLAKEIADRQLTGTVIASKNRQLVEDVQKLLHSKSFRVYASEDMYGVELGGALKNCYAIMCGMAAALGCGQNTIAMLVTRSLAEMSRFAVELGANPMTFLGLSGVGDLIVTCMSPLSRNYRVGYALGEGKPLQSIIDELGQVAEGINTLQIVKARSQQLGIYMPLVNGMYDILHNGKSIAEVIDTLMLAEQNSDVEFAVKE
jgi:glycerol-3-phosphate dehydrogenase (NAD(P)+)